MRWAAIALALLVTGCTSFPESVTIKIPHWMRGQGIDGQQTQASQTAGPATTTAPAPMVRPTSAGALVLPTGSFADVYTGFSQVIAARYRAGVTANEIRTDLVAQGFTCSPQAEAQLSCERVQPLNGACSDVFIVTQSAGTSTAVADVRRRCPVGVSPPA
jgi:hypothetical protein